MGTSAWDLWDSNGGLRSRHGQLREPGERQETHWPAWPLLPGKSCSGLHRVQAQQEEGQARGRQWPWPIPGGAFSAQFLSV